MIAVTGGTAAPGGRVAARLAAVGDVPLRLVVRDAGRAPRLEGAEVPEHPGGCADPVGLAAALSGVGTLYLVWAADAEDRLQPHLDAVDAARHGRGAPLRPRRSWGRGRTPSSPRLVAEHLRAHPGTGPTCAADGRRV